jgi:hypothetical protein
VAGGAPVQPDLASAAAAACAAGVVHTQVGLYPIVTSQYSLNALYQVSYNNQQLFF